MDTTYWIGTLLMVVVGLAWLRSRIRAYRRQAALDAYADREIARTLYKP